MYIIFESCKLGTSLFVSYDPDPNCSLDPDLNLAQWIQTQTSDPNLIIWSKILQWVCMRLCTAYKVCCLLTSPVMRHSVARTVNAERSIRLCILLPRLTIASTRGFVTCVILQARLAIHWVCISGGFLSLDMTYATYNHLFWVQAHTLTLWAPGHWMHVPFSVHLRGFFGSHYVNCWYF